MNIGDVIRSTSIKCTTPVGGEIRATVTQKAYPKRHLLFLYLGGVADNDPAPGRAGKILEACGWIAPSLTQGLDEGIANAMKGQPK